MDSAFYRPRAPDHKEIAAGNPHRQLQTKKRMEERNQGRRISAQLPRIKIPLVS